MNEQSVSDERLRAIHQWADDEKWTDTSHSYAVWKTFAGQYASDIATLCRAELARREADRLAEKEKNDADE